MKKISSKEDETFLQNSVSSAKKKNPQQKKLHSFYNFWTPKPDISKVTKEE